MKNAERNDKGFIRRNCITSFDTKYVSLGDLCVPVYDWSYLFDKAEDSFRVFYQVAAIDTTREDCYGLVRVGRDKTKEGVVWAKGLYRIGTFEDMLVQGAKKEIADIFEWQNLWGKLYQSKLEQARMA